MIKKIATIGDYEIFEEIDEESKNYWIRKKNYALMCYIVGVTKEEKINIIDYILQCDIIGFYNEDIEKLERD